MTSCLRCRQLEEEIRRLRDSNNKLRKQAEPESIEGTLVKAVFEEWVRVCKHPKARLTADRRSKVRARLRDGYTSEDLMQAVRGAAKGAYVDPRGHKWDDLTLICRSGANVERFIALGGDGANVAHKFIA
jgi:hypothetical protein